MMEDVTSPSQPIMAVIEKGMRELASGLITAVPHGLDPLLEADHGWDHACDPLPGCAIVFNFKNKIPKAYYMF